MHTRYEIIARKDNLIGKSFPPTTTMFIIVNIDVFQITVSKQSDGTVRSELTLARVGWKDEGTYTCIAREIISEATAVLTAKSRNLRVIKMSMRLSYSNNSIHIALIY